MFPEISRTCNCVVCLLIHPNLVSFVWEVIKCRKISTKIPYYQMYILVPFLTQRAFWSHWPSFPTVRIGGVEFGSVWDLVRMWTSHGKQRFSWHYKSQVRTCWCKIERRNVLSSLHCISWGNSKVLIKYLIWNDAVKVQLPCRERLKM